MRTQTGMPLTRAQLIITILVDILCLLWLVPLAMMLLNASKGREEYLSSLEPWALPQNPLQFFANAAEAWDRAGLGPGFLASLGYGIIGSLAGIAVASLGAYALTRLRVAGRVFWFGLVFSGSIFPLQMFLIPLFRSYRDLNLYDTNLGMVLFYAAISVPFCLFVLRGFFATIPRELYEAARMDGSGDFRILTQIYLPLARNAIAVLILFQFTWIWNDLVFGLVLATSDGVRPVTVSLASLQDQFSTAGPPIALAGAVLVSLPTVLLFLVLARSMMAGLALTTGRAS